MTREAIGYGAAVALTIGEIPNPTALLLRSYRPRNPPVHYEARESNGQVLVRIKESRVNDFLAKVWNKRVTKGSPKFKRKEFLREVLLAAEYEVQLNKGGLFEAVLFVRSSSLSLAIRRIPPEERSGFQKELETHFMDVFQPVFQVVDQGSYPNILEDLGAFILGSDKPRRRQRTAAIARVRAKLADRFRREIGGLAQFQDFSKKLPWIKARPFRGEFYAESKGNARYSRRMVWEMHYLQASLRHQVYNEIPGIGELRADLEAFSRFYGNMKDFSDQMVGVVSHYNSKVSSLLGLYGVALAIMLVLPWTQALILQYSASAVSVLAGGLASIPMAGMIGIAYTARRESSEFNLCPVLPYEE